MTKSYFEKSIKTYIEMIKNHLYRRKQKIHNKVVIGLKKYLLHFVKNQLLCAKFLLL